MATQTRLVTAEDLLNMPDDGYRYELVRGELRKMAPAGQYHGEFVINATIPLGAYVKANNLGKVYAAETGYRLAPDHVLAPDISFISRERLETIGESSRYWPAAPDLVIEVISPSDRLAEVSRKVQDWLDAGTRMVVVVNSRRREVTVNLPGKASITLTEEDTLDGGDVVPGWTIPVREIFG